MRRRPYQRYSDEVRRAILDKSAVVKFPDLKIPKSTAHHWRKHGTAIAAVSKVAELEGDPEIFREICSLLEILDSAIDITLLSKNQTTAIREFFAARDKARLPWIPAAMLRKLKNVGHLCKKSASGSCLRRYPGQLTVAEGLRMKRMVVAKRYAHLSICSLALLAKRKGILNFSVHTWYKYVARHRWERANRKLKSKTRRYVGLIAKHPHEYWHQDVTKIPLLNGQIVSLQVIQDNCSRAILGWKLSSSVTAEDSGKLLLRVKRKIRDERISHVHLVSDGGPENVGARARAAFGKGLPRILGRVARKEIRHANTMVEIFFKMLKSNFLRYRQFDNVESLQAALAFYIREHNHVIPKLALNGLTPAEVLAGLNLKDLPALGPEQADAARDLRLDRNQAKRCRSCPN